MASKNTVFFKGAVWHLIALFLIPLFLKAQNEAGPDRYLCGPGGSAVIGTDFSGSGNCSIRWTPAGGLSDPQAKMPAVQGITTHTYYTMTATFEDGAMITDGVWVYVFDLDLDLYRPKFLGASGGGR